MYNSPPLVTITSLFEKVIGIPFRAVYEPETFSTLIFSPDKVYVIFKLARTYASSWLVDTSDIGIIPSSMARLFIFITVLYSVSYFPSVDLVLLFVKYFVWISSSIISKLLFEPDSESVIETYGIISLGIFA
jgi:hypothetical protein